MKLLGIIFIACLLGSIPSAYFVTKAFTGENILTIGSKNVGTMNTLRNVGVLPGIITFFIDFGKGALAAWIAVSCIKASWLIYMIVPVLTASHNWSVFLNFKGGKGLAVTAGALFLIDVKAGMVLFAIIGIVTAVTKDTDVATIVGFLFFPFIAFFIKSKQHGIYRRNAAIFDNFDKT